MARIHSILTVTQGGLLYLDIAEITRWIEFRDCYQWYLTQNPHDESLIIAHSRIKNVPMPYIEFFTTPFTRLEFQQLASLQNLLADIQKYTRWQVLELDH